KRTRRRDDGIAGLITAADAELGAELACEIVGGDDNARFDQHLLHGLVELGNQSADFFNLVRCIDNEQRVGTVVGGNATAGRQKSAIALSATTAATAASLVRRQQRSNIFRLAVADRDVDRDGLLNLLQLLAGLGDGLF